MSKLFLYALFVFSPIAVFAQPTFGTVLGAVKDNSDAIVPKAKVSLTDTDENISHATLTDAKGALEARRGTGQEACPTGDSGP